MCCYKFSRSVSFAIQKILIIDCQIGLSQTRNRLHRFLVGETGNGSVCLSPMSYIINHAVVWTYYIYAFQYGILIGNYLMGPRNFFLFYCLLGTRLPSTVLGTQTCLMINDMYNIQNINKNYIKIIRVVYWSLHSWNVVLWQAKLYPNNYVKQTVIKAIVILDLYKLQCRIV